MSVSAVRVTRSRRYLLTAMSMLTGAVVLVGCTSASTPSASTTAPKPTTAPAASSSSAGASASPVAAQSSPAAAAGGVSVAAAAAAAPAAAQRVNPNTASIPDIQAALEANGVPNAARWAREVDEYKPYPTDDLNFGKLRQNLAKYNPAPDVVEKIVSSLTLS